jgi:hypothetical protein
MSFKGAVVNLGSTEHDITRRRGGQQEAKAILETSAE